MSEQYDAGLLNDFGGGNVDWWQDYIRAELGRAHDFYTAELDALEAQIAAADGLATMLENCLEIMQTPDMQQCCDGRECGCMGSTVYQEAEFYARQELAAYRAARVQP